MTSCINKKKQLWVLQTLYSFIWQPVGRVSSGPCYITHLLQSSSSVTNARSRHHRATAVLVIQARAAHGSSFRRAPPSLNSCQMFRTRDPSVFLFPFLLRSEQNAARRCAGRVLRSSRNMQWPEHRSHLVPWGTKRSDNLCAMAEKFLWIATTLILGRAEPVNSALEKLLKQPIGFQSLLDDLNSTWMLISWFGL